MTDDSEKDYDLLKTNLLNVIKMQMGPKDKTDQTSGQKS